MRPSIRSQTGTGSTTWIPMDYLQVPFNVGFGVVASGTVNYTVEHTFDDVTTVGAAAPTVFAHEFVVAKTASDDGNYAFPVRAIRVTVNSGTGVATITVLQGLQL